MSCGLRRPASLVSSNSAALTWIFAVSEAYIFSTTGEPSYMLAEPPLNRLAFGYDSTFLTG